MPPSRFFASLPVIFGLLLAPGSAAAQPPSPRNGATKPSAVSHKITPQEEAFFEAKIRPLLIEHCYECHSGSSDDPSGGLRVDDAASLLVGGNSGPALVAGNVEASLIVKAVRYENAEYEMPPTGKLASSSIELLEQWVQRGAPDPRQSQTTTPKKTSPMEIDPRSHWAFNLPQRYRGELEQGDGDRDVIDSITRQIAKDAGVAIADRCSDDQLIRRLHYDLTGLPPTIDQVAEFVGSNREDKLDMAVDRLLASPAFAERFARHWMDVARYADTVGYALAGKERRLVGSERYRDWLIRSFATDLPLDQMIRLQLSADRIDPENKDGHLDAMGFLTVGRQFLNGFDTIDDRIDVITRGLMGMTVACARCHDHKFDPIPAADYYSLLGILQSSDRVEDGASPLMMVDKPDPSDSYIFLRGQPGNRGEMAPRRYLTALRDPDEARFSDGSGRLELAERLAGRDNPLVSRVFVNRIWMHLIGRPVIDSTSDFGIRTEPTELVDVLDDLASEFSQHWSIKRLIRRIVTSRIYAQSCDSDDDSFRLDPDNRSASRGNRRRRDFESLRDSALAVCGRLDRTIGGPPTEIHLNSVSPRRTLYAMIDRQNLPSLFRTFDFASPDAHTPKRLFTTVPQQALFLMNHPQMGTLSAWIADRVRQKNGEAEQQVCDLFGRILSRPPTADELADCVRFVHQPARQREVSFDPRRAWQYGTTPVHPESRVDEFSPLPVFSGSSWQDEQTLPASSELSYASLAAENGHPGPKHAVVRRWTAPESGVVTISGMVGHRNDQGDGIELAVWVGGNLIWRENHQSNNRPFGNLKGELKAGQTVDFVVSPRSSDSFDSFFLRCQVSLRTADGRFIEGDSRRDFSGPLEDRDFDRLDRLAQLAQTLMLTNEFIFVD
jgi:hypothetical protein